MEIGSSSFLSLKNSTLNNLNLKYNLSADSESSPIKLAREDVE
jgi:hypothetical protein